jgi:hypothetical protein
MTQPLPAPYFGAGYSTPLTDIGLGYATGITSAGKSLAGAIGSVMGSVNPTTGEAQPGLLQQGSDAHQTLDMFHSMGLIPDDTYEKLKTSGLGAQQKAIGLFTTKATAQWQAQAELQRQQASEQAASQRQQVSESGATARANAQIEAERQRQAERIRAQQQLEQEKKPRTVLPPPTTPSGSVAIPGSEYHPFDFKLGM